MESNYIVYFAKEENFIDGNNYKIGKSFSDEIGAMPWTEISNLEKSVNKK